MTIRTIAQADYLDRVKGAWLGKMVGVSYGIPTEFHFTHRIADTSELPTWTPDTINEAYIEDDLYIPFAFMKELDTHGLDVSPRQMAIDLYPYAFEFWGGHYRNFELGIAPPSSGNPSYARTPDSLSYSFAADYSGLIAPGLVNVPATLADRYARLLVYGDGVFGGAYIGAMYTEAFFTSDLRQIIAAGLGVIPTDSWLFQAVSDTITWHDEAPGDFTATWQKIMDKYFWDPAYNWIDWPYGGRTEGIALDTKLNCAFITMALLYGEGDIAKTLQIVTRAGADSDSNPANALGILFATKGYDAIPAEYKSGLNPGRFRYVDLGYDDAVALTARLAEKTIVAQGGRVTTTSGRVMYEIPVTEPVRLASENSVSPTYAPLTTFTPEEMSRLSKPGLLDPGFEESWHTDLYSPYAGLTGDKIWVGLDLRQGKAHTGDNNAYIVNQGYGTGGIYQKRIAIEPGSTYELSCWVRTSVNFPTGRLLVTTPEADHSVPIATTTFTATTTYRQVVLRFESGTHAIVDIGITYDGNGDNTFVQVDDFGLRKVQ